MQAKKLNVDFLYLDLDTCERCKATDGALNEALTALSEVLKLLDYTVAVNKVNVNTRELAEQYRFLSSPTIRVNGTDICGEVRESDCADCGDLCGSNVDCRVFVFEGREYEQPPAAMIADGILRVLFGYVLEESGPYALPDNLNTFFSKKVAEKYSQFEERPINSCCDSSDGKCC